MTPFESIYEAFLAKMLEDEWANWDLEEVERDWSTILQGAIPWFKFPRVSLEYDEDGFISELSNEEIQILANYMKVEWLNRTILTWENIKPLYEERDFSQANLLKEFRNSLESEKKKAKELESIYYRSIKGKPFNYKKLAGDQ
jgi:hypothetical protein